tara:strand:+ start:40332 stop:40919 length:588 start_codon:yes stop_codon:yes gene_type:complete
LFDDVRRELADLLEVNGAKSQYVITRYRDSATSLSTRFNAICVRAGVEAMPKPFPNLRASARRDVKQLCVERDIDPAAVTAWLGHDATTAEKYYDRVTDEDYARAVGTLVGTSLADQEPPQEITLRKKPHETEALMAANGHSGPAKYSGSNGFREDSLTSAQQIPLWLDDLRAAFPFIAEEFKADSFAVSPLCAS